MSAYLMTQHHTALIAAYAGLLFGGSPKAYAKQLRQANNYALGDRYGDKPVYLRKIDASIIEAQSIIANALFGIRELQKLADTYYYQCAEGNYQHRAGIKLLERILCAN